MNAPKVSFIVPVFNAEPYLVECLSSIVSQTIDKEIIIIDDGSTDNSLNIALAFTKAIGNIIVIHQSHLGVSAARNRGMDIARGEWICFVDSDDWLDGDYFTQMLATADEQGADIVRYQAMQFSEYGKELMPTRLDDMGDNIYKMTVHDFFKSLAFQAWSPRVWCTLIRRTWIKQIQLRFLDNHTVEDQLFMVELFMQSLDKWVLEFPYPIYQYRYRSSSISNTPNTKYIKDHLVIIDKILKIKERANANSKTDKILKIILIILCNTAITAYQKLPVCEQSYDDAIMDAQHLFHQYYQELNSHEHPHHQPKN